jgi:hypothetical protein
VYGTYLGRRLAQTSELKSVTANLACEPPARFTLLPLGFELNGSNVCGTTVLLRLTKAIRRAENWAVQTSQSGQFLTVNSA